mmetsp:Transcript_19325/g.39197  ORF Transcript_19325/g.39197 Transcript_19325/m.39197 type:complete len:333 (-) Transcript_19325:426-1424(-)
MQSTSIPAPKSGISRIPRTTEPARRFLGNRSITAYDLAAPNPLLEALCSDVSGKGYFFTTRVRFWLVSTCMMSKRPPSPPNLYTSSFPVKDQRTLRPRAGTPFHGSIDTTVPNGSFGCGGFFRFFLCLESVGSSPGSSLDASVISSFASSFASSSNSFGSVSGAWGALLMILDLADFSDSYCSYPSTFALSSVFSQSGPRITRQPTLSIGGPSPPSMSVRTVDRLGRFQSSSLYSSAPVQTSSLPTIIPFVSKGCESSSEREREATKGRGQEASTSILLQNFVKSGGRSCDTDSLRLAAASNSIIAWTYREQTGTAALSAHTRRTTELGRRP